MTRVVWLGLLLVGCETGLQEPVAAQPTSVPGDAAQLVWETSHDAVLARAKTEQKPVIVEFTADWCVPCQELERRTYPDASVRAQAKRFLLLKIDTTAMTDDQTKLMARYSVQGLPTVVFIDSKGLLRDERVTGFVEPAKFASLLAKID